MKINKELLQKDWKGGIYGTITGLQGIVIHDAAAGMSATAEAVAMSTIKRMQANSSASNYHFVVDGVECYQLVDEKYATYSLGDKITTDTFYPNDHFISIEIAPSLTATGSSTKFANSSERETYNKAWKMACELAADLCKKHGLKSSNVHQHREYGSTSCPYTMEKYYGSYSKALSETRAEVNKHMTKKPEYKWYFSSKTISNGYLLTATRDTYIFNDFQAKTVYKKVKKGTTLASIGRARWNNKGYFMHLAYIDGKWRYVAYKGKLK